MTLKILKNTLFYSIILFVLCIAELIILSNHSLYQSGFLTWVYFISGICIAIIPLLRHDRITINYNTYHWNTVKKVFWYLGYVFFFVLLYQFFYVIETYILNYREADMLPSIEILATRALNGKKVYTPLREINRPEVLYGPGFWLPYTIPILLKIDIRWASFFFFMLGISFLWYQAGKEKIHFIGQKSFYLIIGLACYFYFYYMAGSLMFTQEPVIVGYYLLLGYALLQHTNKYQWLMAGITISLCLLSRFSLLLWIPFYIIYLWKYEGIKKAIQVSSVVGLLVLMLFIVPFGIEGIKKFTGLPSFQANQMAARFADSPRDTELGMAKFFSSKDGWFIYNLQRGFSLLIMVVGIIIVLISPKWIEKTWLPICFLKLTLVFFCNFLQIPYSYLFEPSTFLSLIIVIGFVQQKIKWQEKNLTSAKNNFIDNFIQHKLVLIALFVLPLFLYAIIQYAYFQKIYSPYKKSAILSYQNNLDNLENEEKWIKTVIIDSTVTHTGKYSNKVGLNQPYSMTFRIPLRTMIDNNAKGIRFSVWTKSNTSQLEVSKMVVNVSYNEKILLYKDKNISPKTYKDNLWRKHVFATYIPDNLIQKGKTNDHYILSAFLTYYSQTDYIYVDDMVVEFF